MYFHIYINDTSSGLVICCICKLYLYRKQIILKHTHVLYTSYKPLVGQAWVRPPILFQCSNSYAFACLYHVAQTFGYATESIMQLSKKSLISPQFVHNINQYHQFQTSYTIIDKHDISVALNEPY